MIRFHTLGVLDLRGPDGLEMRALFSRLIARFPTMRLAVDLEDLRAHDDQITGGLVDLPVIW